MEAAEQGVHSRNACFRASHRHRAIAFFEPWIPHLGSLAILLPARTTFRRSHPFRRKPPWSPPCHDVLQIAR